MVLQKLPDPGFRVDDRLLADDHIRIVLFPLGHVHNVGKKLIRHRMKLFRRRRGSRRRLDIRFHIDDARQFVPRVFQIDLVLRDPQFLALQVDIRERRIIGQKQIALPDLLPLLHMDLRHLHGVRQIDRLDAVVFDGAVRIQLVSPVGIHGAVLHGEHVDFSPVFSDQEHRADQKGRGSQDDRRDQKDPFDSLTHRLPPPAARTSVCRPGYT